MTVGDEEVATPLVVLKDPVSTGSEADIRAQFEVILQLREEANAVVDLINEAEAIRAQLVDRGELVKEKEGADEILAAGEALDETFIDFEMGLTDLRMSGGTAGQDALRWPRQLYAKLTSLAGYIGGSDFPPTMQQLEVHEGLQRLLREAEARMAEILDGELGTLNQMLVDTGITHIIAGGSG